ncbi:palmitoyltransferase ZDHHC1-like [Mya arenaria]|uniref:palmitoyltransferase ZDHHC1-like n=1 Tax=Mya arenaria TaxID=6604 RepID=UPI0022E900AF|nr:palmitoyltransferase ZDHHC1-like [Mya arenaria]
MRDVEAGSIESSRKNGWTLPLNSLQVIAWVVIVVYAILHFTTLVPAIHSSWQPAAYIVPGLSLVVHLICHIVSISIDPSDPSVLAKKYPKLKFDRSRHKHVIEECHCHICQVDVGGKSKHCGVCNKCISNFDHHCKWLNNCIGGRNYRWFIATLVTAIVALLLVSVLAMVEFIVYFTDQDDRTILQPFRELNSTLPHTDADIQIFYQSVMHEGWLALLAIYFVLGYIAVALVGHLFGFHVYLICKNTNTYDYIIAQRDMEERKEDEKLAKDRKSKRNQVKPSTGSRASKDSERDGMPTKDYQKILEEAEQEGRSSGETPPPSTLPYHTEKNNNNNNTNLMMEDEKNKVKRLRKKKRSSSQSGSQAISTVDNPRMYKNKGYTISSVDIPDAMEAPHIVPIREPTPRGTGPAPEYHTDSADSLLEVPTDKSFSMSLISGARTTDKSFNAASAIGGTGVRKSKKKKRRKDSIVHSDDDDELNTTTLFTVNNSAKYNPDGSLQYADFRALPLTPTSLRRQQQQQQSAKNALEVPPLDFTTLRGSHESVTFQPYTATMRSTDTVLTTDRLLPPLKEEKRRTNLQPVTDTEV